MMTVEKINQSVSGDAGNRVRAQIMTGDNEAVLLGRKTDGSDNSFSVVQKKFNAYSAEDEPFLDDDFSGTPRLIVAGLLRKKLIALDQSGLDLMEEVMPVIEEES